MKDITFDSQEELYQRLLPALRSKRKVLIASGYKSVKSSDIWDFLRYNKWSKVNGLELCDMVDDILHTNNEDIVTYCLDRDKKKESTEIILPKLK